MKNKKPDNIRVHVTPKLNDYAVIIDGEEEGKYNTIQEISEKCIEALGKGAKQIHIKEVKK